jgi:hypothetical protein
VYPSQAWTRNLAELSCLLINKKLIVTQLCWPLTFWKSALFNLRARPMRITVTILSVGAWWSSMTIITGAPTPTSCWASRCSKRDKDRLMQIINISTYRWKFPKKVWARRT